jgi:hypothetical protein
MDSQFKVNIKTVVISTQIELNKKYLLSQNEKVWQPITFDLNIDMLSNLEKNIIDRLKQYIFVNELELLPQLINIALNENNELDIIYGFLVNYTQSLNNCFWVEFNLAAELSYSNLILEVIQKLN